VVNLIRAVCLPVSYSLKAARNKVQGGNQPLSVPLGFEFLYNQLLFSEAKARQIDAGKYGEKNTILQENTKKMIAEFHSADGFVIVLHACRLRH
jgi:hypothetical protein